MKVWEGQIFSPLLVGACVSLGFLALLSTFEKEEVETSRLRLYESMNVFSICAAIFSLSFNLFTVERHRFEKGRDRQRLHTGPPKRTTLPAWTKWGLLFLNLPFTAGVFHSSTRALLLLPGCTASEGDPNYPAVVTHHSWWFKSYIPCLQIPRISTSVLYFFNLSVITFLCINPIVILSLGFHLFISYYHKDY